MIVVITKFANKGVPVLEGKIFTITLEYFINWHSCVLVEVTYELHK
jgi:hypothetical protein